MISPLRASIVVCCFASAAVASAGDVADESGRIALFDGESLAGWEANRKPEAWSVADGVLRAHAVSGPSRLYVVGHDGEPALFDDIELVAEVRAEPESNGGVYFHTDRE